MSAVQAWLAGDAEQSASTPRRECKQRHSGSNGLLLQHLSVATPVSCAFAELQLCFGSTIKSTRPARAVRACTVSTSIQPTTSAVRTSCDIASKILSKLMSADENSPPTPPRHASQSWSVTFSLRAPTLQVAMRCDAMRSASPMGTAFAAHSRRSPSAAEGRQLDGWRRRLGHYRGRTAPPDAKSLLRADPPLRSCTD